MEIEYQRPNNSKYRDYATYVMAYKNSFKKNSSTKLKTYSKNFLSKIIIIIVIWFIALVFSYEVNNKVLDAIMNIMMIYISTLLTTFFIIYASIRKDTNHHQKESLNINSEGIIDKTEEITISYTYDQIDFIYLKDDFGVIIPNKANVFAYFVNFDKEKLIKALQKYNKDLLVIDSSTEEK